MPQPFISAAPFPPDRCPWRRPADQRRAPLGRPRPPVCLRPARRLPFSPVSSHPPVSGCDSIGLPRNRLSSVRPGVPTTSAPPRAQREHCSVLHCALRRDGARFPRASGHTGQVIEVVVESDEAAAVWKKPGVFIEGGGRAGAVHRAGEPVLECAQSLWGRGVRVFSDLETGAAGLGEGAQVLVAKTERAALDLSSSASSISSAFVAVTVPQEPSSEDLAMSHVGLDGSTSAWEACSRLSSQGRLVVGRTGTPPLEGAKGAHVALVGLSGLPESLGLGCSVNHQVPKKFQKLLRRTAIRDDRRKKMSEFGEGGAESLSEFLGYEFLTSAPQLVPRKSSEAVVKAALDAIEQQRERNGSLPTPVRVLDLGTGCGNLILALLAECQGPATGVGVDLSAQALDFASRNAQAMTAGGMLEGKEAKFVSGDFGSLHKEEVRKRLGEEPFDVIISNPPFLAEGRARGRVTAEEPTALVSGQTGMEAYAAICASVAMCRDPPLLKREGRLLFQAPGGERGHVRVSAVARQKGFKVLGASPDDRGVLRVVVLCHDPAGRDQTRTSDA